MSINVKIKWSGKIYDYELPQDAKIKELKAKIEEETNVLSERQKLLGIKGKEDDPLLGSFKEGKPIMMVGSAEKDIAKIQAGKPENTPEIIDDFDDNVVEEAVTHRVENIEKIDKRVARLPVDILNQPRPGSKLLVLDIDYTLFDHRSVATNAMQLMRPYLHEFLAKAYHDNFDIVIWSATSMRWIKLKMDELGVTGNLDYKLAFMVDSKAMISVHAEPYGVIEVKPLGYIWKNFKQWGPKNTIMFDDLRRNFVMNPQSGLKIRPFKNAATAQATDRELLKLSKYLSVLKDIDDFRSLDHRNWEKVIPLRLLF
ncbi:unnamed protein product [Oikopleura dioica]|uniref:Ubiquitin-like domain-containing CTD phosphatase 1 n=1 Tax=Oikopleura dioica TaxID=34765 RepID=E4WY07_OIKDI|nr:unnamed protein product [Oikopleura dioica]CBY35879.1 unnamed protein product [Oikopleura dioica]